MAEIKNKLIGELSGTFGDVVYHQKNGKNYLSRRPKTYNRPSNEEFAIRTNRFKLSARIASVINSTNELKSIWSMIKPPNVSVYNYLISRNYNSVDDSSVTGILQIVPDSNVGIRFDSAVKTANKMTVTLSALTEAAMINTDIEKKIQLVSLIFLNNPVNETMPKYIVNSLVSATQDFDLASNIAFEVLIPTSLEDRLTLYQNRMVYSTILTFDETGNTVNFSDTFSFNLPN